MIDIEKIIFAAEKGGLEIMRYFGKVLKIEEKSMASDFRTKADIEAEKAILSILQKAFPDFNIYSEEAGIIDKKSEYTFVIDPLDGSNNFVLGLPVFCVSIGFLKGDEIVAGVIHNPVLKETYYAKKGEGAWLKNKKLRVNSESNLERATLSLTQGYSASLEFGEKLIQTLNGKNIKRLLQTWCPTFEFCLLAAGKIEGIINFENELYDYCAGKLIAKEAGAMVTDFEGRSEINDKAESFIISNGTGLHAELVKAVG